LCYAIQFDVLRADILSTATSQGITISTYSVIRLRLYDSSILRAKNAGRHARDRLFEDPTVHGRKKVRI
ncbi:unnamed protein product, partial [Musa hybrid cultivar]